MTGIDLFLTFTVGVWVTYLRAIGFALLWLAGTGAVLLLGRLAVWWWQGIEGTRDERELDAHDTETLAVIGQMHRSRVLIPGLDAPLYIHESPRHAAGVTPKRQPARAGVQNAAAAATPGPGSEPFGAPGPAPAPTDLGPGAGGSFETPPPGYNSHLPSGSHDPVKVDCPAPDDPGAAVSSDPHASPAAAPGLPDAVTAEFDKVRATLADLSRPDDDAQRFPWLMPQWSEDTGTLTAICTDGE